MKEQFTNIKNRILSAFGVGRNERRVSEENEDNDEIPSRELEPLEYFGLTNLPERPILQSGVKVEVYVSSNFRRIIFYTDYRVLRRDVCYNEARDRYGLMRDETYDWFFIVSVNDVPPVFGRNNVPHHGYILESHTRGRRD